jgi:ADP-ribosyl-[dinitrogen reductase] hydrolase
MASEFNNPLESRYRGCLVGLACGDAVGTTVEFSPRGSFEPLTDMVGGGPFRLAPGQWTDDTSMAICLAQSLLHRGGFDAEDQMRRYVNWWRLRYFPDMQAVVRQARLSSQTTHGAAEALECCSVLAEVIANALAADPQRGEAGRAEVLTVAQEGLACPSVRSIAEGQYRAKPREAIRGTGYCVASLEAALWCFATTESFADAVLAAANLGDDADTTAAITGQVAGAFYGIEGIPAHWRSQLFMGEEIGDMAAGLLHRDGRAVPV